MTPTAEPASAESVGPVAIPARLIQDDEEIVLALKPSGWFVVLVSAPLLLAAVVVAAAAHLLGSYHVFGFSMNTVVAVCLGVVGVRLLAAFAQWLSRVYILTNRRVLRVRGVLRVEVFECPLPRVQHTELSLSLPERVFGLGTILFATAGTGAPEAAWVMIAKPTETHEIVVEYIRRAQNGSNHREP